MAALQNKVIAGYQVKIWSTSFRVEGMSKVIHVGHHMNDDFIAAYIANHYPSKSEGKKSMSMNLNTLAFLVRDDVTTMNVVFKQLSTAYYTYKLTRQLAEELVEDDMVVVETVNGIKVAFVAEIHDEPILDPEVDITYGWAIQRVNTARLDSYKATEEVIEDKLRTRRKLSHRQQALAALGISDPENFLRELTAPKE